MTVSTGVTAFVLSKLPTKIATSNQLYPTVSQRTNGIWGIPEPISYPPIDDKHSPFGDIFEPGQKTLTKLNMKTPTPLINSEVETSGVNNAQKSQNSKAANINTDLINFDKRTKMFTLKGKDMEYSIHINKDSSDPLHLNWGKSVGTIDPEMILNPYKNMFLSTWENLLGVLPREFPDTGRGDFRTPAIQITTTDGINTSDLKYVSHKIIQGKPELEDLPSIKGDKNNAQTMEITLKDKLTKAEVKLMYTVFKDSNVICRSSKITNKSKQPISLDKLASLSMDFMPDDYKLLQLNGKWANERQETISDVSPGKMVIESNFGASGHEHNPFLALMPKDTTNKTGKAYGFSLLYSGSFSAEIEQDSKKSTRVIMGINPQNFKWTLEPGESFQTPECVGAFSSEGVDGLTKEFHQLYKDHLMNPQWKEKTRPVLLNTWEATYCDVDYNKIINFAKDAKELGVELMVLDDGWFGDKHKRNVLGGALGDWTPDPAKFPNGIGALADDINKVGLKFGIWMEPEMVSPKSKLFKEHPDWVIQQNNRAKTKMRNQYVLDLGNPEVQQHIINSVSNVLDSGNIEYIKWDMNRPMTEMGSLNIAADKQMETQHRYMLGLYKVLDTLTKKYPDVLWEGCASGGGRFDAGMLKYFDQIWTSDNTDPLDRLKIQAGTAMAYPSIAIGSHVGASPNPTNRRNTSLKFRFHTAMSSGNLGLEIDPSKLTESKKRIAGKYIDQYKEIRSLVQTGNYHSLKSPFNNENWPALMYSNDNGSEAVAFLFQKENKIGDFIPPVKLEGLKEDATYSISGHPTPVSGKFLMEFGLSTDFSHDYDSKLYRIKEIKNNKLPHFAQFIESKILNPLQRTMKALPPDFVKLDNQRDNENIDEEDEQEYMDLN